MSCLCSGGFEACTNPASRHCFVCFYALCEGCSRQVLTKTGWVTICGCGDLCLYALQVVAARVVAS